MKKLQTILITLLFGALPLFAAGGIIKTDYIDRCTGDTVYLSLSRGEEKVFTNFIR